MEAYLGTVCAFGFNYAPYGWSLCQGQILPISQYSALFSLLGTYYGGNGTSNFALPNLQGRSAIHQGQLQGGSQYVMGETGGVDNVSVLTSNMPAHSHTVSMTIKSNSGRANAQSPVGVYPGLSAGGISNYNSSATNNVFMKAASVTLGTAGGSTPINIDDPSLVMNFCVAMQGIFPTRN